MTITEHGSAQLVGDLSAIAAGLDTLDGGARDTVSVVVAAAKGRAPVRTGALARSLHGTVDGSTATVGSPVSYGLPVHFGVPSHNQHPQPFLHSAVSAETARILAAYTKNVQSLIEQKV